MKTLLVLGLVGLVVVSLMLRPLVMLIIVGVLLAIAATPLVAIWAHNKSLDVDRGEWIEKNRQLLDTIPVYRGASPLEQFHKGHPHPDAFVLFPEETENDPGGPYAAYTTYRVYKLPGGARPTVVMAFYEARLTRGAWSAVHSDDHDCSRRFQRNRTHTDLGAPVTVDTCEPGLLKIFGSHTSPPLPS
jgi:hypothetical protein